MAGSQERTLPMGKKIVESGERRVAPPVRQAAPPPEPSPSPRTLEARRAMTQEEVAALVDFVTRLTESSAVADSVKEQRRLLFAIGNELKRLKPDSAQAEEVMQRMAGFQLELGQKTYRVKDYLTRGTFGAAFVVEATGTGEEDVLKLSLPFDRNEMFAKPGASMRDVMRAEQIRNTIMEAAALSRLSRYDTPSNKPKDWIERKDNFPPMPLLRAAEFIPHPDDPNRENPSLRIQALVMEKIEGTRLDQVVHSMDLARDPNILRQLARELVLALRYIHNRGVFHSDLKLSNIILDKALHPYLLDFGSAQVVEIANRQVLRPNERVVYGKVDNMFASKDYITGFESPSAARDIYAAGIILRKVIQGNYVRRQRDTVEDRLRQLPEEVQSIYKVAERMSAKAPEQRPTVDEILKSLEAK